MTLKSEKEIKQMRKAGQRVARILEDMGKIAVPGISTYEIDQYAESRCKDLHCIPAFKGYRNFPGSVCISVNEEAIHGIPSRDKILKDGDIVGLDFGVIYNGWYGDAAKTIGIGKVDPKTMLLLQHTEQALNAAIRQCWQGNTMGDLGEAIQKIANEHKYSIIKGFSGHGIGRSLHEDPSVPNFGKKGQGIPLQVGMVLAIEPMFTLGSDKFITVPDGWTVVTADFSMAAHFEHTVAITVDGPKILTQKE